MGYVIGLVCRAGIDKLCRPIEKFRPYLWILALLSGNEQDLDILARRQHLANPQAGSPLLPVDMNSRFFHENIYFF